MPETPIKISPAAARRFMIHAVRLHEPHASVTDALDHHGYAQIDPINVCGRMHDLILRNRVAGYSEGDLMRTLYSGGLSAFETYHPLQGVLAVFPTRDWRYLAVRMRRRAASTTGYYGRLSKQESKLADLILAEVGRRGPLDSSDFESGPKRMTSWGSKGTLVKKVFEKLFVHGRLLICRRDNFRRVYDLPERVLPREVLDAPVATDAELAQWGVLSVLRQRRLAVLRKTDAALVTREAVEVAVEGCPRMHILRSDLPLLERAMNGELTVHDDLFHLLAPLDPLIYDRKITLGLWGYEYIWEVYTPPAKRKRGYYALPVLSGERLVGHVDPKMDRAAGRLRVVSRKAPRGVSVAPAVKSLALFLGMKAR